MKQINLWLNEIELKTAVEIANEKFGINGITALVRYLLKAFLKKNK